MRTLSRSTMASLAASTLLGSGAGHGDPTEPEWFDYEPAAGWTQRELPPAIIQPPTMITFIPPGEFDGRVRLHIRDITDMEHRLERIAPLYARARAREGRMLQRRAREEGSRIPDVVAEFVSPSMRASGDVQAVYVLRPRDSRTDEQLIHFIHARDGRRYRVDYIGHSPHFDAHRREVMASLRSIRFTPGPRERGPSRSQKLASLKEQLDGTNLSLYDGAAAGTPLTDDDLRLLRDPAFAEVDHLNLIAGHAATLRGLDVTDAGLRHITHLPLTFLCLRGTLVTDRGLAELAGLPLRSLVLDYTLVDGSGLRHMQGMSLDILDLANTSIEDDDLLALRGLPLRSLWLTNTSITDRGLRHLRELPLKVLVLAGTDITDDGLRELDGTDLSAVVLPRHISSEALERFRATHPDMNLTK